MPGHMKRSHKRKSRRSRRTRKRRGGQNVANNAAFKAKMASVAKASAKTMADANKGLADAAKAKQHADEAMRKARVSGIPSICKNEFMKNTKKCKDAAAKMAEGAKVLKNTSAGIKKRADALKKAGLVKLGGKRRRKSKRRRSRKKSRKSRRKSRKSRRKSKRRRSRRRRR